MRAMLVRLGISFTRGDLQCEGRTKDTALALDHHASLAWAMGTQFFVVFYDFQFSKSIRDSE